MKVTDRDRAAALKALHNMHNDGGAVRAQVAVALAAARAEGRREALFDCEALLHELAGGSADKRTIARIRALADKEDR